MFYGVGSAKHREAFATVALALAEGCKRVRETRVANTGRDNQATGACRNMAWCPGASQGGGHINAAAEALHTASDLVMR